MSQEQKWKLLTETLGPVSIQKNLKSSDKKKVYSEIIEFLGESR